MKFTKRALRKATSVAAAPESDDFIRARPRDIVLGKGNGIKNHRGNKELRSMVEVYSWEYDLQPKICKRAYAADLSFIILHGPDVPRRVLMSIDGTVECCEEVKDADVIIDVVMHRLRNGRKRRSTIAKKEPYQPNLTDKQISAALAYFLK